MTNRRQFVITGASSAIGRVLAEHLDTATDADMVLVSRSENSSRFKRDHLVLTGIDLTNEQHLEVLREKVGQRLEGPFTVFHCVGDFWTHKPLVRTTFEEVARMINSHYLTFCGAAWSLLPVMVARNGGRLVGFSCNSVAYNYPDMAPFTSAKAALECFVRCVANEYSEYNIIANAVSLPTIRTDKVMELKPTGDHDHYITPEELAIFLSDITASAPAMMNGNVLKVFRHSKTFFHQSYFDRNPRELEIDWKVAESDERPKLA